ncbi:hypothetical protein [Streptomyces sp. NPDC002537]
MSVLSVLRTRHGRSARPRVGPAVRAFCREAVHVLGAPAYARTAIGRTRPTRPRAR